MNLDNPRDETCLNAVQKLDSLREDFDGTQDKTILESVRNLEGKILDYWNPTQNSILLVSKHISGEVLDILYGENIFKLHLHGEGTYFIRKNFTDRNRQRMRYLLLIARPMGVSYRPERIVDDPLWRSILPHLKGLRIILEQPVEVGSYYNAPTLECEMGCWVDWIRPMLQCFGGHLSIQTEVEIDCDVRAETRALAKDCLPYGYQEIRCRHVGDFVFKRGQFSWESGYWDGDGLMNSRDADGDWDSD
ncbi:uncharacterized protein BDR25DRAFT_97177 [Lindgomyces ingoldianus]|uniref:Uncharacterized protein n=1 Tax=Lindgomyces ingoldianus TaxID=673940 RepID=A0ACB6QBG6_9PLEO|nr:uncharacterized protein BDR25DRAFT_97177 [Lindgomyces ingoldianus]KAF2464205.1 hypothetical protein BDR25DRAFT_97177 [Lindgomyces ingoldianus]